MEGTFAKRIAAAVISVLLLLYVGYQIYTATYKQVKTETAVYMNVADTVEATGYIIRDEATQTHLIKSTAQGVVTYDVEDGGKVPKDGVVAQIYKNAEDAAARQEIASLNNEIDKLNKLSNPGSTYAASQDALEKQIDEQVINLISAIGQKQGDALLKDKEDLTYLLNERQIVTNKVKDFSARVSALTAKRDGLSSSHGSAVGQVTSPVSGFFISSADGYEDAVDYTKATAVTADDLKNIKSKAQPVPAGTLGKVVGNFEWYIACTLQPDDAKKFTKGNAMTVNFPFASSTGIPVTVAAVNQSDKNAAAAVVFKATNMTSELASVRNENVQIELSRYSGIRVSKSAVHIVKLTKTVANKDTSSAASQSSASATSQNTSSVVSKSSSAASSKSSSSAASKENTSAVTSSNTTTVEKEVQGVYVMYGNELVFKQIFPLYANNNFVICNPDPPKDELMTNSTVKLYDEVVVEGTGLYDGKVIK